MGTVHDVALVLVGTWLFLYRLALPTKSRGAIAEALTTACCGLSLAILAELLPWPPPGFRAVLLALVGVLFAFCNPALTAIVVTVPLGVSFGALLWQCGLCSAVPDMHVLILSVTSLVFVAVFVCTPGIAGIQSLHCGRLVHIPIAVLISLVYLKTEDQTLHNIFAACFALQVLTLVSLGRFAIGIVLLGGLALYDAFRISGALAAVTSEAGSLGLVQVILPMSWDPRRQLTIGIGNIAVPGVFVAMCLRFDAQSHLRSGREAVNAFVDFPKPCFWSTFCACSLAVLISGCSVAEPALLHLVPGTLIIFVGMCYVRGQLGEMWAYNEEDLLPSKDAKSDKQR